MSDTEEKLSLKVQVRDYLKQKGILDSVLDAVHCARICSKSHIAKIMARETGSFKEEELETLIYEFLKRSHVQWKLYIVQLSGEDYDVLLKMMPDSQ